MKQEPGTLILTPPNDGDPVERVWMFVSRDKQGRENVCGSLMGALGIQPLMTGNPKTLEVMKAAARALADATEGTGRTVHLLSFAGREEVEGRR